MTESKAEVIDTVKNENRNQWNHVIEQSDLGSLFHRHGWLLACEKGLDREPYHVVVRKGDNPIGVFPNFRRPVPVAGFSDLLEELPVTKLISADPGAGGPAILTDEQACLEAMFDAITEVNELDVLYHTIKTTHLGFSRYSGAFRNEEYECRLPSCRFRLDLNSDWETIRANMHKSRRQGLRRAENAGVEVSVPELSGETMREIYTAHAEHMDRIDVDPSLTPAFLQQLYDLLDDRIVAFVASCDGEEVGRYLHLLDDERSTINYYLAGIPTEEALDVHVAEALHSTAIQWGQDHGYDYYDFGETAVDLNSGVFKFKRRFGGELVPMLAWQRGFSKVGWSAFKMARTVYERRKR